MQRHKEGGLHAAPAETDSKAFCAVSMRAAVLGFSPGMRWFGFRLQLLVTAAFVLLAAAAADRSHYFCRMMERAVAECCCPDAHEASERSGATAKSPDCCDPLARSQQPVAAAHDFASPSVLSASLVATLPAIECPEPSFRLLQAVPSLARAPPALGPPLFISHCALLI